MSCKILHALYKNNKKIGYLLGSLHANFNPQDYEKIKIAANKILKESDEVFFEIMLPHYTQLSLGIERAFAELLEENYKPTSYFENGWFQKAMLLSSLFFGTRIVTPIWFSHKRLNKNPRFFYFLTRSLLPFLVFYNTMYNLFYLNAHSLAVQNFRVKQQELFSKIFSAYQSNESIELPEEERLRYLLKERDQEISRLIINKSNTIEKCTLFIVGTSHLAGKEGVVNQLKEAGLRLKALNFFE